MTCIVHVSHHAASVTCVQTVHFEETGIRNIWYGHLESWIITAKNTRDMRPRIYPWNKDSSYIHDGLRALCPGSLDQGFCCTVQIVQKAPWPPSRNIYLKRADSSRRYSHIINQGQINLEKECLRCLPPPLENFCFLSLNIFYRALSLPSNARSNKVIIDLIKDG